MMTVNKIRSAESRGGGTQPCRCAGEDLKQSAQNAQRNLNRKQYCQYFSVFSDDCAGHRRA